MSTHPVPSAAVTAIAVVLGIAAGLEPLSVVLVSLAFLANQASIGLSNDWIDADRDRAVGRTDKPVARGLISSRAVAAAAFVSAALAITVTVPLGWRATLVHAVFIASAWSYNLGLKRTVFSLVPYVVSFGLLPMIVTLSAQPPRLASVWAVLAGSLLGVSAHFANVLPDLSDDAATGVRGLPHRAGRRVAGLVIAGALAGASLAVVIGLEGADLLAYLGLGATLALALVIVVLVVRGSATRRLFPLILVAALMTVVLLALSGQRLFG